MRETEMSPPREIGQCIVKVNKWEVRESLHFARKLAREKGTPIRQDLTKRCLDLLMKARGVIDGWEVPEDGDQIWAYANINCDLVMRRGKVVKSFQTDNDLREVLDFFNPL